MTEATTDTPDTPLSELYARDPLELSRSDVMQIVTKLRAQRKQFVAGNMTVGKAPSKKSAVQKKSEAASKVVGELDLGDLGL